MAIKDYMHVKEDDKYESLRIKGMSNERAAKIANSSGAAKRAGTFSPEEKK